MEKPTRAPAGSPASPDGVAELPASPDGAVFPALADATVLPASPDATVPAAVRVLVRRLDPIAELPRYQLEGDAGADLITTEDAELAPGARAVLPTGLAMALPAGYAAFVHPRSGLAASVGLSMVNAPGTIDAGYRGEIKVIAINLDPVRPIRLHRGERIAQLVLQRVERADFAEVDELPGSPRGVGGHGSTGGARALDDDRRPGGPSPTAAIASEPATASKVSPAGEEGTA